MKLSITNNLFGKSIMALAIVSASAGLSAAQSTLEEILVTAEKREASMQEVPISISAVSGETMREMQITQMQDLSATVPSMAFSRAAGEAQIYIRGIGNNTFGIGVDPSVAMHLDGVYLGRSQMAMAQFMDVERVEVLRGPQGTLYGRNATGGSVNIISRKATSEWSGNADAYVGNFERRSLEAAIGGPLSDTVGMRVALRGITDDGFTDDKDPRGANEIDDQEAISGRLAFEFTPSETFSAEIAVDWSEFDSHNRSIIPLDDTGIAQTLGALPPGDYDETRNNLPSFLDYETGGARLNLEWQISDNVQLTSITAYREYEDEFRFNTDGTEMDVTETHYARETDQLSQELRLSSLNLDGWSWQLGYFYFQEDKQEALGLPNLKFAGPLNPNSFNLFATNDTTAHALFGQVEWDINDRTTLILGGRYSDEEKEDWGDNTFSFNFDGLLNPDNLNIAAPANRERDDSWDAFTPKFGIQYRPSDDQMYYATVSKGFKSGGTNSLSTSSSGFDPEELWSYEAGVKTDWSNGRWRANASVFYYDYEDLQVLTFVDGTTRIDNAATADILGGELELTGLLTDELTWNLGLSLLDSEYDDFISTFGINSDGSPRVNDLSGNSLINAPETKVITSLRYEHAFGSGAVMSVLGQLSYQSEVFFSKENEGIIGQDGFTLVDLRIGYIFPDKKWEVAALVKNLADEEYLQNGVRFTSMNDVSKQPDNIGHPLGYPGEGRSYGVQVSYRF